MVHDPRTRDYVAKRIATGNSRKEIMRILKRYIVRELFPLLIEAFGSHELPLSRLPGRSRWRRSGERRLRLDPVRLDGQPSPHPPGR
jgi:hypothetical protein